MKHMGWKMSLITSFCGVFPTMYYLLAMTENVALPVPAMIQISIVLGPFAALGLLAWLIRSHPVKSLVLFAFTLALVCLAMFSYSVEYKHFLDRDPATPGGSNWMPFLLALAQWVVASCLAMTLLPLFIYQNQKQSAKNRIKNG